MDSIQQKLDDLPDLPTLPHIVVEVNRMMAEQNITVSRMCETIERDQVMVARILKLVNSSFYGFQSQINTVSHAVVILGFQTMQNAILSVSIIESFKKKDVVPGFDMTDFWKHSVAVAVISMKLGEMVKNENPEVCFTAGLLHDIGKVVLAQFFPEMFRIVWNGLHEDSYPSFYEAESDLLETDHARIGDYLGRRWQLPPALIDTIRCHHSIKKNMENLAMVRIVHAADILANTWQGTLREKPVLKSMDQGAKKYVDQQINTLKNWFPATAEEIRQACKFFLGPPEPR
ncbi:MAG: HDOD domain-containing protein [Deltaproteobacteria bacterium]|nr:HDOD domain-containing protein [Deltaproteobacteria bacterium]